MTIASFYDAARIARFYSMALRWRAFLHQEKGEAGLVHLLAAGSRAAEELSSDLEARAVFMAAVARAEA